MKMERRSMARSSWPRIIDREYVHMMVNENGFDGAVGLINLKKCTKPATILYGGKRPVTIIDDGYHWLQIAAKNESYWLTVMYNQQDEIVQFYFDITDNNNILDNGESWFYDLFLDVVILPDGTLFLLDEDELCQALDEKVITKEQYDKAYITADNIIKNFNGDVGYLYDNCNHYFNILRQRISK